MNDEEKCSEGKNAEGKQVTWDEAVIAEHDKERGTRMKIEEPKTPYHYGEDPDEKIETDKIILDEGKEKEKNENTTSMSGVGGRLNINGGGRLNINGGEIQKELGSDQEGETPFSSFRPSFDDKSSNHNMTLNPDLLMNKLEKVQKEQDKKDKTIKKRRNHYKGMGNLLKKKWDDDED